MIYNNITQTIGNTPIIKLNNLNFGEDVAEIYAKLEYFNPAGSVKDRAAYYIIKDFNLIIIEVVNSALALAVTIGLCGLVVVSLSHLFKMDEYESTIKKVLIKVKKKLLG